MNFNYLQGCSLLNFEGYPTERQIILEPDVDDSVVLQPGDTIEFNMKKTNMKLPVLLWTGKKFKLCSTCAPNWDIEKL